MEWVLGRSIVTGWPSTVMVKVGNSLGCCYRREAQALLSIKQHQTRGKVLLVADNTVPVQRTTDGSRGAKDADLLKVRIDPRTYSADGTSAMISVED